MHRLLAKQIKQHLGERAANKPEWRTFFNSVDKTYADFDEDQALLNRSIGLSSKEFLSDKRRLEKTRVKVEKQARSLALRVAKRTQELNDRVAELEDVRKAITNLLEDFEEKQEALAAAKAKDEALLGSIGEGVVATNRDGRVIVINKVAEDLLGFTKAEMIGKLFVQVISLEDEQGQPIFDKQKPIILCMTSLCKIATTAAYYFVRKDGTKFPVAITATPVLLDAKPTGTIVVFRDITKEKAIEKLRVDFLSLASHQLRTPLSGTKWLIETIQSGIIGGLNPKQKEYLNNIYQINERMIRLVSDMLNVLVLESSGGVVKKQEIPISQLTEELFLMMAPAARRRGVILHNALKGRQLSSLKTDLQILRTILECFISNAISYSSKGQEVVLDAKEDAAGLVFSVKDDGIGIPLKERERIFERFYRASNAKEFKPNGTGLGLYTAWLLAQKIGGKIFFESEKNKGSIFYLRLSKGSKGWA